MLTQHRSACPHHQGIQTYPHKNTLNINACIGKGQTHLMDNTGRFELFIKYVLVFLCKWIPADKHFFFLFLSGSRRSGLVTWSGKHILGLEGESLVVLLQRFIKKSSVSICNMNEIQHEIESQNTWKCLQLAAPHYGSVIRRSGSERPWEDLQKNRRRGKSRYLCILFMYSDQTLGSCAIPLSNVAHQIQVSNAS